MISDRDTTPRVAIACQGGGSHTAFTAGVLDRFLSEDDVEFDVVGLSGTSGGAICAFAAWFGLASDDGGLRDTNPTLLGEYVGAERADPSSGLGSEGAIALARALREAAPDLNYSVEPTGRRVAVDRLVVYHLNDGRIIETGIVEDTLGLQQQLAGST